MPRSRNARSAAPARKRVRRGSAEDAEALRADLLEAAMGLFADGGLDAVTMRAVADQVGVSVMTPYRYFADKAELLRGLWQTVLRATCDEMRAAVDAQQEARARQRAWMTAFFDHWEAHPDHFRLVYQTQPMVQKAAGSDEPPAQTPWTAAPVYAEMLQLAQDMTAGVAHAIGAPMTHAKLAGDVRFAMMLGYLQAALVNKRYPWVDKALLREAMLGEIAAAVERVLLKR